MKEVDCIRAIRAGMAACGVSEERMAAKMGIRRETLSRKLNRQAPFKLREILLADEIVKWTEFTGRKR